MEQKENQRVQLTKRLLKEALLRLLERKSLDEINVSELCREAEINRATFYKHYAIPQDVLRDMERQIAEELRRMAPTEQTPETAVEYMKRICDFLQAHRPVMQILLECRTDEEILKIVTETNCRYWSHFGMKNPHGLDADGVKLMVTFFSAGAYHMIRQWLLEDVKKTPRELAEMMFRFVT